MHVFSKKIIIPGMAELTVRDRVQVGRVVDGRVPCGHSPDLFSEVSHDWKLEELGSVLFRKN